MNQKAIHDSYACRTGKGTHATVKRLQMFMRGVTRNGKKSGVVSATSGYSNFFMSIQHPGFTGFTGQTGARPELAAAL